MTNVCSVLGAGPRVDGWEPTLFDAAPIGTFGSWGPRTDLGAGAWLDCAPGFLTGAGRLLDEVTNSITWESRSRPMYDRIVAVPRLLGRRSRNPDLHPVLAAIRHHLDDRYGVAFHHVSYAFYRDGSDSVAPHSDRVGRTVRDPLVAVLSLGAPRRFLLTPIGSGSPARLEVRGGDLVVMGGRCQTRIAKRCPRWRAPGRASR